VHSRPSAIDAKCYPKNHPSGTIADTRLRSLKPNPGKTERLVADGSGLYIRIRAGEGALTRTWQFRRREGGKLSVTTLGTYPALPILEARQQALELATKRTSYSPTVEVAAEQWLSEQIDHTHRKADLIRGYVERAVIPGLGSRRVRDVEPSEIATVVRDYRDRAGKKAAAHKGGRTAARVLLGVFKGLFGYAVANGWIRQSPAAQLTAKLVGPPGEARTRVLSDDEISFVMTTGIRQGPVLRFLLATGLRIGEAYNGHREGQYWVVPPVFSKNKREHRVWLSEMALAQLERFPWEARRNDVQRWLADNAGGWCAHDLRRTFSTRLNAMGVAPHVVERMLNHMLGGVMAIYNHATYDSERREALETWSMWLQGLTQIQAADVVSIRAASRQAA
jgi:integrase